MWLIKISLGVSCEQRRLADELNFTPGSTIGEIGLPNSDDRGKMVLHLIAGHLSTNFCGSIILTQSKFEFVISLHLEKPISCRSHITLSETQKYIIQWFDLCASQNRINKHYHLALKWNVSKPACVANIQICLAASGMPAHMQIIKCHKDKVTQGTTMPEANCHCLLMKKCASCLLECSELSTTNVIHHLRGHYLTPPPHPLRKEGVCENVEKQQPPQ